MTRTPGPIRTCARCRRDRPHWAKNRCRSCYTHLLRSKAGRYDALTGNPGGRGVSTTADAIESRVEDYALLRSDRAVSRAEAARRVGISYRTALRYDQRLKDQA